MINNIIYFKPKPTRRAVQCSTGAGREIRLGIIIEKLKIQYKDTIQRYNTTHGRNQYNNKLNFFIQMVSN